MADRAKVIKGLESLHARLLDVAMQDSIFMLDASMVANAIVLLKEQEEQKRKWLNRIADAQITVSPTGFESAVELAKRTGEWNGLQMAFDILTETGGEVV